MTCKHNTKIQFRTKRFESKNPLLLIHETFPKKGKKKTRNLGYGS